MKNFIAIILAGISVATFAYYIDPIYEDVKMLRAEEAEFDEALENTEKVQEVRDLLLSQYNSFSAPDLERLGKMLPDHIDNVRLIIEIDAIASRSDLLLKNVKTSEVQMGASGRSSASPAIEVPGIGALRYGTAPLSFTVGGGYSEFQSFLLDIEKSLRLMDIVSLSIKPSSSGGDEPGAARSYEYEVQVNTYWLKPIVT